MKSQTHSPTHTLWNSCISLTFVGTVTPLFQSLKNCWYCAYGRSTKRNEKREKAGCNSPIIPEHLWYRICISHLLPDYCKCFVKLVFPSNQSILKEISPEYSLEGLKLKLQYCGHLMRRPDSLEKTLMLGKTEGRRRGRQRMRRLDGITDSMDTSLSKLRDWWTGAHGVAKSQTWLSDWTELSLSITVLVLL